MLFHVGILFVKIVAKPYYKDKLELLKNVGYVNLK